MSVPDTAPGALSTSGGSRRRVNYDPTINLGHVLSLAAFLISGSVAYFDLRQRVALTEQRINVIEAESMAEKQRLREALSEIKSDLREVRRGVDGLQRKP